MSIGCQKLKEKIDKIKNNEINKKEIDKSHNVQMLSLCMTNSKSDISFDDLEYLIKNKVFSQDNLFILFENIDVILSLSNNKYYNKYKKLTKLIEKYYPDVIDYAINLALANMHPNTDYVERMVDYFGIDNLLSGLEKSLKRRKIDYFIKIFFIFYNKGENNEKTKKIIEPIFDLLMSLKKQRMLCNAIKKEIPIKFKDNHESIWFILYNIFDTKKYLCRFLICFDKEFLSKKFEKLSYVEIKKMMENIKKCKNKRI